MNTERRSILKTILAAPLALLGIKAAKAETLPNTDRARQWVENVMVPLAEKPLQISKPVPVIGEVFEGVEVLSIHWDHCSLPYGCVVVVEGRPAGARSMRDWNRRIVCWAGVCCVGTQDLTKYTRIKTENYDLTNAPRINGRPILWTDDLSKP